MLRKVKLKDIAGVKKKPQNRETLMLKAIQFEGNQFDGLCDPFKQNLIKRERDEWFYYIFNSLNTDKDQSNNPPIPTSSSSYSFGFSLAAGFAACLTSSFLGASGADEGALDAPPPKLNMLPMFWFDIALANNLAQYP